MNQFFRMFVLVAAVALPWAPALAEQQSDSAMQAAQFLVGTWSCHHSEDSATEGSYTTTYSNALGGHWLKQTWNFPASAGYAGMQGDWFFGYDARNKRWVRFGAMSDGMYFAMTGQLANNAWSWRYALPGTNASAVLTKKSDTEYTVDGPSYTVDGKPVTEHHDCRKT